MPDTSLFSSFFHRTKPNCRDQPDSDRKDFYQASFSAYKLFSSMDSKKGISDKIFCADTLFKEFLNIHRLLSTSLLGAKNLAGRTRQDELFVVRQPKGNKIKGCEEIFLPQQIAAMLNSLKKQYNDQEKFKENCKAILIAYQKFFFQHKPTVPPERKHSHGQSIIKYAKSFYQIDIKPGDFIETMSEHDKSAFNILYKLYLKPKQVDTHLKLLCETLVKRLQCNDDALDIAADFFYEFLMIKPFIDANGRFARLIANAILFHGGYLPIDLNSQQCRSVFQHYRNQDPSKADIKSLFKRHAKKFEVFSLDSKEKRVYASNLRTILKDTILYDSSQNDKKPDDPAQIGFTHQWLNQLTLHEKEIGEEGSGISQLVENLGINRKTLCRN